MNIWAGRNIVCIGQCLSTSVCAIDEDHTGAKSAIASTSEVNNCTTLLLIRRFSD